MSDATPEWERWLRAPYSGGEIPLEVRDGVLNVIDELRAKLAAAYKLLQDVETVYYDYDGHRMRFCPFCDKHEQLNGPRHEKTCELLAFFRREKTG